VPKDFVPGPLELQVSIDIGPLAGKLEQKVPVTIVPAVP
jgi:hypothetical protein